MDSCGLDFHGQMLLDTYRADLPVFEKMQEIVRSRLEQCIRENGLYVTAIESRIKTESSLAGKIALKGYKYRTLSDITDLVGARIITFYTDEVDKIASLVEKIFEVDWSNSVDKRKMLDLDRFGYMSLHYVCRIPASLYRDEAHPEINGYRFEIQMRTALQHVWATMHHDTGYKSGVEIPKEYLRSMNRIAGVLELADEELSHIRMEITDYRRKVCTLVENGNFDEVQLNGDTFRSYLNLKPFRKLVQKIAGINQAEIYEDNLMAYLDVLLKLKFRTLGDIERLIHNCSDEAYQLSLHQIAGTDLDIIAQSVALQNLCCVYILKQGWGIPGLEGLYNFFGGNPAYNHERAVRTYGQAVKINIIENN